MFKCIRRRFMPSCKDCKWCIFQDEYKWGCTCPKMIYDYEKRKCGITSWEFCYDVRGTRSCKFEPKEVKEDI